MFAKTFSQLSAKAKAFLGAGLLFLAACSASTSLDPLEKDPLENAPTPAANQNPKVTAVDAEPASLGLGQTATITVTATDPDGDALSYSWSASVGNISGKGNKVAFLANNTAGTAYITVEVKDGRGGVAGGYVLIDIR